MQSCVRFLEDKKLALVENKLKFNLATNRLSFYSGTLKSDLKHGFSDRYTQWISAPLVALQAKFRKCKKNKSDKYIKYDKDSPYENGRPYSNFQSADIHADKVDIKTDLVEKVKRKRKKNKFPDGDYWDGDTSLDKGILLPGSTTESLFEEKIVEDNIVLNVNGEGSETLQKPCIFEGENDNIENNDVNDTVPDDIHDQKVFSSALDDDDVDDIPDDINDQENFSSDTKDDVNNTVPDEIHDQDIFSSAESLLEEKLGETDIVLNVDDEGRGRSQKQCIIEDEDAKLENYDLNNTVLNTIQDHEILSRAPDNHESFTSLLKMKFIKDYDEYNGEDHQLGIFNFESKWLEYIRKVEMVESLDEADNNFSVAKEKMISDQSIIGDDSVKRNSITSYSATDLDLEWILYSFKAQAVEAFENNEEYCTTMFGSCSENLHSIRYINNGFNLPLNLNNKAEEKQAVEAFENNVENYTTMQYYQTENMLGELDITGLFSENLHSIINIIDGPYLQHNLNNKAEEIHNKYIFTTESDTNDDANDTLDDTHDQENFSSDPNDDVNNTPDDTHDQDIFSSAESLLEEKFRETDIVLNVDDEGRGRLQKKCIIEGENAELENYDLNNAVPNDIHDQEIFSCALEDHESFTSVLKIKSIDDYDEYNGENSEVGILNF